MSQRSLMKDATRFEARIDEVLWKYDIILPEAPLYAVAAAMERMENNAVAAEREAIAKYCDLVEDLISDQPPLGERIRRGWHLR